MRSIEQLESGFVAPLESYGLVRVSGEDAVTFIHGQLSHDIARLKADEARMAGYCTPEGRLLAILLVWKSVSDIWLMMPREILPALLTRLQIYILRSKVTMTDVSDEYAIHGLGGKKAPDALASVFSALPDSAYDKTESAPGTLIRVTDAFGGARFLWVLPAAARAASASLSDTLYIANDEDWALGDIAAGLPQVYEATQNRFVPQMMNMELVDGLSFTKGCYPGQEIVARTQFRGTLKRRMLPAYAGIPGEKTAREAGIVPGLDVFDTKAPHEACGIVVRAARFDTGRIDCLMVVSRELSASGSLRLGALDGPALHITPLPYALPDEAGES
ncbi:folate-binding protein [Oxalobacter vibrioformis]|uniref:Folate-binding protein n=1 Tax=Oxalobacter vibrioformis TaxID=933080 RepID=A0A9E9LV44_9BURK|nr:folate-binding protein [Oxalobacter vibrioformis]WAW10250.1 folate-binding protein [Oxalobacter vibrioformis]